MLGVNFGLEFNLSRLSWGAILKVFNSFPYKNDDIIDNWIKTNPPTNPLHLPTHLPTHQPTHFIYQPTNPLHPLTYRSYTRHLRPTDQPVPGGLRECRWIEVCANIMLSQIQTPSPNNKVFLIGLFLKMCVFFSLGFYCFFLFEHVPFLCCFFSRILFQRMVWGPVDSLERDCYLMVPPESQTTNPKPPINF